MISPKTCLVAVLKMDFSHFYIRYDGFVMRVAAEPQSVDRWRLEYEDVFFRKEFGLSRRNKDLMMTSSEVDWRIPLAHIPRINHGIVYSRADVSRDEARSAI